MACFSIDNLRDGGYVSGMTQSIIIALLMCMEPAHYAMTRAQCAAAVEAARHDPKLSHLVAMIEENA